MPITDEDFQVGDLVRFANQLEGDIYAVIIKIDNSWHKTCPYLTTMTNGYNVWMSEWDLEKIA
jgi:hypothetical protein